jgi:hypothetical protein
MTPVNITARTIKRWCLQYAELNKLFRFYLNIASKTEQKGTLVLVLVFHLIFILVKEVEHDQIKPIWLDKFAFQDIAARCTSLHFSLVGMTSGRGCFQKTEMFLYIHVLDKIIAK